MHGLKRFPLKEAQEHGPQQRGHLDTTLEILPVSSKTACSSAELLCPHPTSRLRCDVPSDDGVDAVLRAVEAQHGVLVERAHRARLQRAAARRGRAGEVVERLRVAVRHLAGELEIPPSVSVVAPALRRHPKTLL